MKIALISSGYLPVVDGVTVAIDQRLRSLSQRGDRVLVLCPHYGAIASIYPHWRDHVGTILPGVRVVGLASEPFMGVEFERNMGLQARRQIQRELAAFQPDIIHVDEPDRLFLGVLNAPGVAYARAHEIPCVGFYHTNFVDYIDDFFNLPPLLIRLMQWGSMQIIRRVFNAYDATLVSNSVTLERVKQLGITNAVCDRFLGVDIKAFQQQRRDRHFFETHYGLANLHDPIKIVCLGRLTPDKGWWFTLRALADWVQHRDRAPWVERMAILIAGDGELRQPIRDRLSELGLTVHLLGRIPPAAVPPLLVNSDLLLTTSEKETLGLTILEAFAAGIPAIAPRAGGVVSLIRDGENGLLYQPQDVESFGRSLLTLLQSSDLRRQLGQQAQRDVAAHGWQEATTRLIHTWETQIANRNSNHIASR